VTGQSDLIHRYFTKPNPFNRLLTNEKANRVASNETTLFKNHRCCLPATSRINGGDGGRGRDPHLPFQEVQPPTLR
jgi:hypothetical protein